MKHETTFFHTKKPKKNSPWCPCENVEHGLGVLKVPLLIIPSNDGAYFLPWEVRKEGPFEKDDILVQRKDGFENGFHQKWVCSKSAQEHKDLEKYWGRGVKGGWETSKSVLLEKKWWGEYEKSSGRRRWIVIMVEESMKEEAKANKKKEKRERQDK